jgi:hypothetical protein
MSAALLKQKLCRMNIIQTLIRKLHSQVGRPWQKFEIQRKFKYFSPGFLQFPKEKYNLDSKILSRK